MEHSFDGLRTYLASSDNYKQGFRLQDVQGQDPLNIPNFTSGCNYSSGDFRLCWQCHAESALMREPDGYGFLDCNHTAFF